MAERKSVTFSPFLEQVSEEVSIRSSETDLFPDGWDDVHIASLSKRARKYLHPTDDEPRVPRGRKIALLTLGFIFLLGIGGVVIYLVTRELYNREQHYYSETVSENRTGSVSGNTSINESMISVQASFSAVKYSSESGKKHLSRYSIYTTICSPSEGTTPVAMTLKPATIIKSSGLVTRYETKKRNPTKSTFFTPKLSSPRTTMSHWLPRQDSIIKLYTTSESMRHTLEPGEWNITSPYYLDQGTSSWNDDDLGKRRTSIESGFLTLVSSLNIIRSTGQLIESTAKSPVLRSASYNMSHQSTTGTLTTTVEDIRTLVSGVTSSGSANVWSSISTAIRNLSQFEYSKSAGVTIDLEMTTKERDRSKLGLTSLSALTYRWDTSEAVDLTKGGIDMSVSRLSSITKSSPPLSLSYKLPDATNVVNSTLEGSLPGNKFSNEWMTSQSISPIFLDEQYSTMVKPTSSVMKSSFSGKSRSAWSMPGFHVPAVGSSIHESASSFIKAHETRQSVLPSKRISTESTLDSSGSSRADSTTAVTIPFPSLSLFTNQGSSAVDKDLTPTIAITQKINSSTLGPRSTRQVVLQTEKHSRPIFTSPWYTRHYGISASRDVPSMKTTTSLLSLQQTRPSISQPQSGIKATSFHSSEILKSNSDPKSSSLGSSPSELNSLSVAMVSSYGSVSSHSRYGNLPTFTSTATTLGFSSLVATENIVSFGIPASNSKSALASGKIGTQPWHSAPLTNSLQHLNTKSSVKEGLPTNITIQTTKLRHAYQQTLQKGTRTEIALSTITSSLITRALSLKQFTTFSQGLQSNEQSSSTGQLRTSRISSHSENTRLSTVSLFREHLTSKNAYETSQHQNRYTTKSIISTIIRFSITTVMSNATTAAGAASRTRISQLDNAGFSSNISSTLRSITGESLNASPLSKKAYLISSTKRNNTLVYRSSDTPENATGTKNSIATMSSSIQSTLLSPNKSSASRTIPLGSSDISLYGYNATNSSTMAETVTVKIFQSSIFTSKTQVKLLKTTDSNSFSTVLTSIRPTSKSTQQFKIMDGSLVIRNRKFHANMSNSNTTMFKTFADEVEEIIMDIVSSEVEVTSFRNGSIIASFNLLVAHDSPFTDRDYAEMLGEANETQWRGYQVANITVTLRSYPRSSAARLQDGGGLSKAAAAAIFTVFSVLLIAVGCFGVYICKKKGLCESSRIKPADSPIPPSELEKIQPVRRGTWFMKDDPSLKVDKPKDPNHRGTLFYEALNMRDLKRNNTETDEGCYPDLLRTSTRSPIGPEYTDGKANSDSGTNSVLSSASRNVPSVMEIVCVDRSISGSSRKSNVNIVSDSTHSKAEC